MGDKFTLGGEKWGEDTSVSLHAYPEALRLQFMSEQAQDKK